MRNNAVKIFCRQEENVFKEGSENSACTIAKPLTYIKTRTNVCL
jgi:hypothetical protein